MNKHIQYKPMKKKKHLIFKCTTSVVNWSTAYKKFKRTDTNSQYFCLFWIKTLLWIIMAQFNTCLFVSLGKNKVNRSVPALPWSLIIRWPFITLMSSIVYETHDSLIAGNKSISMFSRAVIIANESLKISELGIRTWPYYMELCRKQLHYVQSLFNTSPCRQE